jgi:DNA-binding CsgD family transcriptional regulator
MQNKADSSARKQLRHAKPPFVGVGGKIEERVDEARDPWDLMREEAKRLREEPLSGFTYLAGALYKENLWRTRLRAFGLDAQNARNPQEIPGARQAQTAKERSKAHGVLQNLLVWQTAAKAGLMIIIGAWALDQVVAGFRRSAGAGFRPQALLDVQGWLPGPPELSDKLFDVLHFVVVEARAEVLGYCMEEYPDDPGSEQAAYLHAGLLRTRMDPEIGDRRIAALSTLAGADNARARELQLRQELPGALPIAWDAVGLAGGISGLRDSVARIIEEAGKDVVNREAERRVDPTESVDETLALRSRKKKKDPEQEFGDDVVLSLTPERSAEELPGIQLFQTQEAVRQELEERIKRYGLTKKEAKVARLRFEGKETHEIATTMGTKEKTIWVHERNIRQKTCSAGG